MLITNSLRKTGPLTKLMKFWHVGRKHEETFRYDAASCKTFDLLLDSENG